MTRSKRVAVLPLFQVLLTGHCLLIAAWKQNWVRPGRFPVKESAKKKQKQKQSLKIESWREKWEAVMGKEMVSIIQRGVTKWTCSHLHAASSILPVHSDEDKEWGSAASSILPVRSNVDKGGGNGRGIKRGGEKGKAQLRVKNGTTGVILRVIYGSIPHPTSGCQPQKWQER